MKFLVKHPNGTMEVVIDLPFPSENEINTERMAWVDEQIRKLNGLQSVPDVYVNAARQWQGREPFIRCYTFILNQLLSAKPQITIRYPDVEEKCSTP